MGSKEHLMQGLHKLTREQRIERVKEFCQLTDEEVALLKGESPPDHSVADNLIENTIGVFPMPIGVASYFRIDGRDILIPMVVEETSVVAAASGTAKWIRQNGSIRTYSKGRLIIGQVQIPRLKDPDQAIRVLNSNRKFLIDLANEFVPGLVKRGGGVRDVTMRLISNQINLEQIPAEQFHKPIQENMKSGEPMLVLHVLCDPCDAMGANLINQVCEGLKPSIEQLTGERVGLCILSNLVDGMVSGTEVVVRNPDPKLRDGIVEASRFAEADPYRAATHNKGILNGIDPVLIATGNDWRAVEAGSHAFASRSGQYRPLSCWTNEGGDLVGRMEIPLAVGTVGGVTKTHPFARLGLKILGIERAEELARICAAVGLVQNLGALKALSSDGIVKGHMKLHASNLALAAGADVHEIAEVRSRLGEILLNEKRIDLTRAKEVLSDVRNQGN